MQTRCRRDHRVFDQSIGYAMLDSSPFPKGGRIPRQSAVARNNGIESCLDLGCPFDVLFSCQLDAGLHLADRDGG